MTDTVPVVVSCVAGSLMLILEPLEQFPCRRCVNLKFGKSINLEQKNILDKGITFGKNT